MCVYVFERVYSSYKKMKVYELRIKEKGVQVRRFIADTRLTGKLAA